MSEAQTFRTEKSQPEADPPAAEMGLISEGSIRSKSSNRPKRFERLKRLEHFEPIL
jgi:hypothetical protein